MADDHRGGFWSTVPGVITGVALMLAIAVVALLAVIYGSNP
jgi:hypothetical protein